MQLTRHCMRRLPTQHPILLPDGGESRACLASRQLIENLRQGAYTLNMLKPVQSTSKEEHETLDSAGRSALARCRSLESRNTVVPALER